MRELLAVQDGVLARRQLVGLGLGQADLDRMLRRRALVRVHRGVYLDHTGPPTWSQRAWAAVLVHHPAALTRGSALPDPPPDGAIHVAIDVDRTVPRVPGVVAHRTARWRQRLAPASSRPRLAPAEACVEVLADVRDPWEAFAELSRVCQTRATTPAAVAAALRARHGVRDRALLLEMLDDLGAGACSVLERAYLRDVERAHRLPGAVRQHREVTRAGVVHRDAAYAAWGVLVELDGRAFHAGARQRERDLDRDLEAAVVDDRVTLRLGWRQVLHEPCRTAWRVGAVLRRRGWPGSPARCPRCPEQPGLR